VFSVKCDICKVVPVCATQAFRVVEVQLHTHTHTTSAQQYTDMNGLLHTRPPPMSSEQEVGWEPELLWALWSKEKSLPLPGIKLRCLSCHTCGLLNILQYYRRAHKPASCIAGVICTGCGVVTCNTQPSIY